MTPALLKRTWRVDSWARKDAAEVLMVVRSLRSRCRKMRAPLESGASFLMSEMAWRDFSSERAAM